LIFVGQRPLLEVFRRIDRPARLWRLLGNVGLLWRGERGTATRENARLRRVFEALADSAITAEAVVYRDAVAEEAREQLLRLDGVLVWVDPIGGGEDRVRLDAMLREVSARDVWVSAHPDTILKMATKEVLYRTKTLGWGTDTFRYASPAELREQLPPRLAEGQPRVLKQNRGNGGIGVWKVTLLNDTVVRVQHAAPRDAVTEDVPLATFMDRCEPYFARGGQLIDQAFVARLPEGMIRAYLVGKNVVGFARQQPAVATPDRDVPPADKVLGLPSPKTMYDASEPAFAILRARLEEEWVPGLQTLVELDDADLPLLWDADFLYGPKTEDGADTYVLCEINASSVTPFPDQVPLQLANAVRERLSR